MSADLTVNSGGSVYIKWSITDDVALPAASINIYYATLPNDSNWQSIATNINPDASGSCTPNTGGAATHGCYVWTSTVPTSQYFRVRFQ